MIRKFGIYLVCAALAFMCACTQQQTQKTSSAEHTVQTAPETPFDTYVSNTVISTGNNAVVRCSGGATYRAWLPVTAGGSYSYCFYYSNTVDSTYGKGKDAYAGRPGAAYTIESARIGASAYDGQHLDPNEQPETTEALTFDGAQTRNVDAGETFWSDPVRMDIPVDGYLLYEWTVRGDLIPATAMSNLAHSYVDKQDGKGFLYSGECPLPQLIGVERSVKARIACLGDSITQGAQTTEYGEGFWAAEVQRQLGDDYAVWNLGLGYARASDCAQDGDWLERACMGADIVNVAYGTNDIVSGAYGGNGRTPDAPQTIAENVGAICSRIRQAGKPLILWNAPPFDLSAQYEQVRTEYNQLVPETARAYDAVLFDCAELLADPADAAKTVHGQHPDDVGGKLIADALVPVIIDHLQETGTESSEYK